MKHLFSILCFFMLSNAFAQEQFSVFFESNKFDLIKSENDKLNNWIAANTSVKIVAIEGYTDEDGSDGFNDTLAKKRVDCIYKLIKYKINIRDDFKTRSFGENFKQSKNKADNRKVSIFYILPKDLNREDEILGIKKTIEIPKPKPEIQFPEKMVLENPDGTKSEIDLDVAFMKQVSNAKVGEKLKLDNLNFYINSFGITLDSRDKLYELLIIMEKNPALKIDIQGHLCCNPIDKQNLSGQRAKAVYGFLVANNIDKSRISYKGFGSTQPIYSLPEKTDEEKAANRRVEIMIVEN